MLEAYDANTKGQADLLRQVTIAGLESFSS